MSKQQIVILGGGTGGTMTANRLRRRFDLDEAEVHVVDRDDRHVYQQGLLFVPFGLAHVEEIVRPRARQLRTGVTFHHAHLPRPQQRREDRSAPARAVARRRARRARSRRRRFHHPFA